MEFTLLWAVLTAVVMVWVGTKVWPDHLPDSPFDRMIGAATGGLFIGRLTAMLSQGINPIAHPLDILIVRGGVYTGAAVIGTIGVFVWMVRGQLRHLDAVAPATLAGLAGWHAGCLWRGACLGTISNLPWAWSEPTTSITRHPVEIYAAIGFITAGWLVSRLSWRMLAKSGSALALAGLIRLATEPMRPSLTGGPKGWYLTAILLGLVVVWVGPRLAIDEKTIPT